MAASGVSSRRRTAFAERQAAKQRRQRNIAIVGFVLLIIVGAYEVPHTLKLIHKHGSTPTSAPVTSTGPATSPAKVKPLKHGPASDPFAGTSLTSGDPQARDVGGGHDPFAAPTDTATSAAPSTPVASSQPLPKTIVIGSPGRGKVAQQGWIVILASIPTHEGRSSAAAFAQKANRNGVQSLSILNSSNRRPLRGGYWVVYTGPYPTLNAVSSRASEVHAAGYGTAYIRELIVYK